ncbi:MAG: MFS transporter [Actinomycetes bacterium]
MDSPDRAQPPHPPAKVPLPREIWVLVSAALVIALGFGLIAPILPQYAASFDVGLAAASAIVTVFSLTRMAFAPAAGQLIARFGERWMYLAGLAVVAASSFLCAAAQGYVDLLVWRALGGIGSVTFTVSSMGLIVRLAPPSARGRTSALYGSAFLLGNVTGPLLGTALAVFGYRVAFATYGVAVVVALLLVAVFLGSPAPRSTSTDARPQVLLSDVLGLREYRSLLATAFANGWANFGVRIALIPLMASNIPSIGAPFAGLALTVFALGNVTGQQFSGRLVDAKGRRPVLMTGLLVAGVATVVFGWASTVPVFLALSALAGLGASMVQPASQAMLADIVGSDRNGGQALSTYSMATDLGSITGTLTAGVIADLFGFGWAFALTGLVLLGAIFTWIGGTPRRPRPLRG